MGGGTWSSTDYARRSFARATTMGLHSYADARADQVFEARKMNDALNPKMFTVREARDSDEHPESTPVVIGLDVTGSMGPVLAQMATTDINALMSAIYDRRPITDPQVMCLGVGDVEHDRGPLQATQFESDIRIADQLEMPWLESGGGGNSYESYSLPWWFATARCATDAWEKRQKKGYVFTIGDEFPNPSLPVNVLRHKVGEFGLEQAGRSLSTRDVLEAALERWEVFHVVVMQGNHARHHPDETVRRWRDMLGQRVILLRDHTKLAEVIVSAMQVAEGVPYEDVVASWSGDAVVADAVRGIRLRA